MKNKKKSCHTCAYKGSIPGNCHIKCTLDWSKTNNKPPKGNPHEIKNGWFMFPYNFDPIWQESECPEHSDKLDKDKQKEPDVFGSILSMLGKRL
ncbi:hypothetical protein COB55_03805 [Candidatus Wolfebacteria bacterium]|nr:MAG: hypothetical protein COB55_03805 [Candidatus Wolfebacteria bacterium]